MNVHRIYLRRLITCIKLAFISCLCTLIAAACRNQATPTNSSEDTNSYPSTLVSANPPPSIIIKTDSSDNKVVVNDEAGQRILNVYSSSGIGNAELSLSGNGSWPVMIIQFHLRGLEKLQISYPDVDLIASISSSQPFEIRQYQIVSGGTEQVLEPSSPYWVDIQLVNNNGGTPTIPLENGFIHVALPENFYAANPDTLSMSWVDFFR